MDLQEEDGSLSSDKELQTIQDGGLNTVKKQETVEEFPAFRQNAAEDNKEENGNNAAKSGHPGGNLIQKGTGPPSVSPRHEFTFPVHLLSAHLFLVALSPCLLSQRG